MLWAMEPAVLTTMDDLQALSTRHFTHINPIMLVQVMRWHELAELY